MNRPHYLLFARGTIAAGLLLVGIALGRFAFAPHIAFAQRNDGTTPLASPSMEAMVFLPLADNSGRPFSEETWHDALGLLVVRFGGATLNPAQEGCWLDERGRVQREPIRAAVVSFAPERLNEFRAAVRAVGQRLGQDAMYVRFQERRVELVGDRNP